jgi:hypothetical protein
MKTVSPALSSVELLDESSKPTAFSSIYAEKPAIVVFLRHFG